MTTIERAGEVLVRRLDRSTFLRKSAAAIFGFTAAAAVQGIFPSRALANNCVPGTSGFCTCHLPGYPSPRLCTNYSGNCIGGNCDTRYCSYNTDMYSTGCWCSMVCCYQCQTQDNYCGFYHCCDCNCPPHTGTLCGCQGFVTTCQQIGSAANSPDVYKCC